VALMREMMVEAAARMRVSSLEFVQLIARLITGLCQRGERGEERKTYETKSISTILAKMGRHICCDRLEDKSWQNILRVFERVHAFHPDFNHLRHQRRAILSHHCPVRFSSHSN
jgi:transposase InsO family protein